MRIVHDVMYFGIIMTHVDVVTNLAIRLDDLHNEAFMINFLLPFPRERTLHIIIEIEAWASRLHSEKLIVPANNLYRRH